MESIETEFAITACCRCRRTAPRRGLANSCERIFNRRNSASRKVHAARASAALEQPQGGAAMPYGRRGGRDRRDAAGNPGTVLRRPQDGAVAVSAAVEVA